MQQLKDAGCSYIISEQRSAYNEKGRRPGWEELQQLVASGKATTVVAISQSRLSRREDVVSFLRVGKTYKYCTDHMIRLVVYHLDVFYCSIFL